MKDVLLVWFLQRRQCWHGRPQAGTHRSEQEPGSGMSQGRYRQKYFPKDLHRKTLLETRSSCWSWAVLLKDSSDPSTLLSPNSTQEGATGYTEKGKQWGGKKAKNPSLKKQTNIETISWSHVVLEIGGRRIFRRNKKIIILSLLNI